jgi:hypothetical protein
MFRDLGVFVDKATAALEAIGAAPIPPAPAARARHRILRTSPRSPRSTRTVFRLRRSPPPPRPSLRSRRKALSSGAIKGFAGAANGSDIIFHEVCAAEAISTTALLALPVDDYAAAPSTMPGRNGASATTSSFSAAHRAFSPTPPTFRPGPPNGELRGLESQQPVGPAQRARRGRADITLIVLWDGKGGDGPGGTADIANIAEKRGMKVVRIDPAQL